MPQKTFQAGVEIDQEEMSDGCGPVSALLLRGNYQSLEEESQSHSGSDSSISRLCNIEIWGWIDVNAVAKDLLVQFFSLLQGQELRACCIVCKFWHRLIGERDEFFWRPLCAALFQVNDKYCWQFLFFFSTAKWNSLTTPGHSYILFQKGYYAEKRLDVIFSSKESTDAVRGHPSFLAKHASSLQRKCHLLQHVHSESVMCTILLMLRCMPVSNIVPAM